MDSEFRDGRLFLKRSAEDRQPIVSRLAKIEGQVRGIRQMIEEDRHCLDELTLANAVTSAMREVALLIASQHLQAGIRHAVQHPEDEVLFTDLTGVLRAAMKTADGQ
jgi:CsoR family transcriptional regulator, copper-sensing transcriptional repressor